MKIYNWFKNLPTAMSEITRVFFLNYIAGFYLCPKTLRYVLYRFGEIHTKTRNITSRCFVGGNKINIDAQTMINDGCFFDLREKVSIGNDVCFVTSSYEVKCGNLRSGPSFGLLVTVEDGCWIGANIMFLPGVTNGKGCIIAAGYSK